MAENSLCTLCHISNAEFSCARCFDVYCSAKCHKIDWPRHRFNCLPYPSVIPRQAINIQVPDSATKVEELKIQNLAIQVDQKTANPSLVETRICPQKEAILNVQQQQESQQRSVQNFKRARESTNDQRQPQSHPKPTSPAPQYVHDNQLRSDISKPSIRDRFVRVARQHPKPKIELHKPQDLKMTKQQEVPTKPNVKPVLQSEDLRSERSSKILKEHQNHSRSKLEREIEKAKEQRITLENIKILLLPEKKKFKAKVLDLSLFMQEGIITVCENSKDNNEFYAKIQDKINKYAEENNLKGAEPYAPLPDEVVLARFDNEFYRGICLAKKSETKFEIQFVDYGNVDIVPSKYIRKLPTSLALPICAHSCLVNNAAGELSEKQMQVIQNETVDVIDVKIDTKNSCYGITVAGL